MVKNRVSKNLKKHGQILCLLAKAKPKVIKSLIAGADNDLIKTISTCSLDLLNGEYALSSLEKKRLKKYKNSIRQLTDKKSSLKKKRALLMKGGSMVSALLGVVAPLLIKSIVPGILNSVVKRKLKSRN